jgi:hypothetical protein
MTGAGRLSHYSQGRPHRQGHQLRLGKRWGLDRVRDVREPQEAPLGLVQDLNLYARMPRLPSAEAELEFQVHRIVSVRAENRNVELIDAHLLHAAVDPQPQKLEQLGEHRRITKSDNHWPQLG